MSSLDPFYLVKEEIEDNVKKMQATYGQWEKVPSNVVERANITNELLKSSSNIEWQLGELDRAIAIAERDPKRFSIDASEIEQRKKWTTNSRDQIQALHRTLQVFNKPLAPPPVLLNKALAPTPALDITHQALMQVKKPLAPTQALVRQELMQAEKLRAIPLLKPPPSGTIRIAPILNNDNFVQSDSDRQALLIKSQDRDLDDLGASVERLGDVGMTIHDELVGQVRLIDDVEHDIDTTSTRLDFVQKKMELMIMKAGSKGQIFMIVFLIILFLILVLLIFYT